MAAQKPAAKAAPKPATTSFAEVDGPVAEKSTRLKSPSGSVTSVPDEIVQSLLDSGYTRVK